MKTSSSQLLKARKRLLTVVNKVKDENFLVHLYEMIEARVNENEKVDIVDSLTAPEQKKLFAALARLDKGEKVSHSAAIKYLKSV
jgi:hypothetical protein